MGVSCDVRLRIPSSIRLQMLISRILSRRTGRKTRSKIILILACIILHAIATLHCILTITSVFRDYQNLQKLLLTINGCLEDLQIGATCAIDVHTVQSLSLPTTNHCALAMQLATNVCKSHAGQFLRTQVYFGRLDSYRGRARSVEGLCALATQPSYPSGVRPDHFGDFRCALVNNFGEIL